MRQSTPCFPRNRSYVEIILHLGPRFRDVLPNGDRGDLYPKACVTGPQTRAQVIEAPDAPDVQIGIEHAAASLARHHGRVRIQSLREQTGPHAVVSAQRYPNSPSVPEFA